MKRINNKLIKVIIIYISVVVTMIVLWIIFSKKINPTIQDIENISNDERIALDEAVLSTVSLNYGGDISRIGNVVVRKNTIDQKYDDALRLLSTSFIVDIPNIRQSYRVSNIYSPNGDPVGDYTRLVTCVFNEEIIFEPFNCRDRLSEESNLQYSDPILLLLLGNPFYNFSVVPAENINGKVSLHIIIDKKDKAKQSGFTNEVRDFIRLNGLDVNDYILKIRPIRFI